MLGEKFWQGESGTETRAVEERENSLTVAEEESELRESDVEGIITWISNRREEQG